MVTKSDPLGALAALETSAGTVAYYRLARLSELGLVEIDRLPFSIRVLLENLLRRLDGAIVTEDDVRALAGWGPGALSPRELPFLPARVLLQDLTGIPVVADLAALRSEVDRRAGDPQRVNPEFPVDLVVACERRVLEKLLESPRLPEGARARLLSRVDGDAHAILRESSRGNRQDAHHACRQSPRLHQFTPTAVQASVRARSTALPPPYRSRAAWIVAERASEKVAPGGSISANAR